MSLVPSSQGDESPLISISSLARVRQYRKIRTLADLVFNHDYCTYLPYLLSAAHAKPQTTESLFYELDSGIKSIPLKVNITQGFAGLNQTVQVMAVASDIETPGLKRGFGLPVGNKMYCKNDLTVCVQG